MRDFHGRGLGKALLQTAEQHAMANEAKFITVETLSPKQADENYLKTYQFYQSCGFQPLFNLKPSNYRHTMVYMAKLLEN